MEFFFAAYGLRGGDTWVWIDAEDFGFLVGAGEVRLVGIDGGWCLFFVSL